MIVSSLLVIVLALLHDGSFADELPTHTLTSPTSEVTTPRFTVFGPLDVDKIGASRVYPAQDELISSVTRSSSKSVPSGNFIARVALVVMRRS
jgi:hypothetical protein